MVPVEVEYLLKAISHQMPLVCSRQVSLLFSFRYLGGLGGVNIKSSADCSLRLDFPVSGCSIVVRYLGSWYAGEPQKETIVRIEKPGLCSFGRPYSFGGCGTLKRRSRVTFEFFVGLFVVN